VEIHPLLILVIGVAVVIGMMVAARINAFIALITASMVVSVLSPGDLTGKIGRVATAFGATAASVGIVIALAAVIGKCLMDSGAADRIVLSLLGLIGQKRASLALTASGFTLSIPVFFDTAFYLLVPLAKSAFHRQGKNYLLYLMAIVAGAAATHTLVPPTPGPLFVANQLGVDLGVMILVGAVIGLPAAGAGLLFGWWLDRRMPVVPGSVRDDAKTADPEPRRLPSLAISLAPIVLPIALITTNSFVKLAAQRAMERQPEILSGTPAERFVHETGLGSWEETAAGRPVLRPLRGDDLDLALSAAASEGLPLAELCQWTNLLGDPNLALLLAAGVALFTLWRRIGDGGRVAKAVEQSLMSGGVIILITAAGGAFGGMLKQAGMGGAIEELFGERAVSGLPLLFLAFSMASLLKFAQGSSTAAMIVTSGMVAAMIEDPSALAFHPVYLAVAVGGGSLVGSWMNDSGFWIYGKMGELSEVETLQSWTPLLAVVGAASMAFNTLLAVFLPLR